MILEIKGVTYTIYVCGPLHIPAYTRSKPHGLDQDAWAANDLLDKRASIYASCPPIVVFAELGSGQSSSSAS
ncbi:hypothetical protein IMZ48_48330 [Candidatus Bathyarchaeota archaeon]|nr:hypothetical protein [Candidatus Bathyarchaeota archaeon]